MGVPASVEPNDLTYAVIGAIIEVHRQLGPGLPETVYEEALALELTTRRIPFERQKAINASYKGQLLQATFRLDFLVAGELILELKAVEDLSPVHDAQLLAYLKLTGVSLGLLVNFNVEKAKEGIRRKVMSK